MVNTLDGMKQNAQIADYVKNHAQKKQLVGEKINSLLTTTAFYRERFVINIVRFIVDGSYY